ncbi:MAG: metallophosphoesterase [Candidatus Ratteibacteria bacterium]
MKSCTILVIADLHYVSDPEHFSACKNRKNRFGKEFLRRVLLRHKNQADLIVLMGDITDNPDPIAAESDLKQIVQLIQETEVPAIFVRGNHDIPLPRFLEITGNNRTLVKNGYLFFAFYDEWEEGDNCVRPDEEWNKFLKTRASYPDTTFVVFQHNPIFPKIKRAYPYNLTDFMNIAKLYEEQGVTLSVSGHYHAGLAPFSSHSLTWFTAPALCEKPFQYGLIQFNQGTPYCEKRSLMDNIGLDDYHCHTEFAYCGTNITIAGAMERSDALGVRKLCFTEHAAQLYLPQKSFGQAEFLKDPQIIEKYRHTEYDRMSSYLTAVGRYRGAFIRAGLEVDPTLTGKITLREEDRKIVDVITGAVHFLGIDKTAPSREIENRFLSLCETLCRNRVDILAHPWRWFRRNHLPVPTHLYPVLAEMLKSYGVAAEINFHTNTPDPAFFQICLELGIKISLGTDAHCLAETGEFSPHVALLSQLDIKDSAGLFF